MRTCELEGATLDYWVARAEGYEWAADIAPKRAQGVPAYSTDWAHGGLIIEREKIAVSCIGLPPRHWQAYVRGVDRFTYGDTPLIAAMLAYVASKFGDTVPDETVQHNTQQHSTT